LVLDITYLPNQFYFDLNLYYLFYYLLDISFFILVYLIIMCQIILLHFILVYKNNFINHNLLTVNYLHKLVMLS